MAKPATRMKSIVLKSYSESRLPRLGGSLSPGAKKREDCAALSVCCDQPPQTSAPVSCSPSLREDLRATIENMVIPRLIIGQCLPQESCQGASDKPARRGRVFPTASEVDLLARIAVQPDLDNALELALGMLRAGLSMETVLLHLIGPAARRLGTDWEEDQRSFADVTVGLGTLHEMVHILARRETGDAVDTPATSHSPNGTVAPCRQALLVGSPGEQHTLGLYIFAELLRHSRWVVAVETSMSDSALLKVVRSQSLDMLGMAVSTAERFTGVVRLIRSLRRASLNRALRVVVGGPVDLSQEAQKEDVRYFSDARTAVAWLDGE